jgi:hypothetical protein
MFDGAWLADTGAFQCHVSAVERLLPPSETSKVFDSSSCRLYEYVERISAGISTWNVKDLSLTTRATSH